VTENGKPDGAVGALLEVEGLRKVFTPRRSWLSRKKNIPPVRAVDGVSFHVTKGETFGLVGESGCGKSTIARCILRLVEPDAGRIVFDETDVLALERDDLRRLRRRMQMVFQDPFASLNPRMAVQSIVEEPLVIHGFGNRVERQRRVLEILELVGITREQGRRKPHEFSGGQRQRIAVARALVVNPDLVILDEPVSALDVSIQAQVLNLLRELQRELHLTYVFIVHDLAVAEYFCDRLAVLYLGAVMELADRRPIFRAPLHPYTEALLSAAPIPDPAIERERRHIILRGEVTAISEVSGCRFKPRCPVGRDREACETEPLLLDHGAGHLAACHFPGELRGLPGSQAASHERRSQ
jgi:oligopeptide/dipeptide ABC transporter ATP-binding protein